MYTGDPCSFLKLQKLFKSKNVEIEEFDVWKYPSKAKMLQRTNGAELFLKYS